MVKRHKVSEETKDALGYLYVKVDCPMTELEETVFPSETQSIVAMADGEYGTGAHDYLIRKSLGFKDGQAVYSKSFTPISFVKKLAGGKEIAGVQSEQLLIMLKDRHEKLNAKYPSEFHEKFIAGLNMALEAQRERVESRMGRGVMGKLEK